MDVKDFDYFDVEAFRIRLRGLSDQDLIKYGRAARSLIETKRRIQSAEPWQTQLAMAREEWRRRYPKAS
jgi:hypothetical protein